MAGVLTLQAATRVEDMSARITWGGRGGRGTYPTGSDVFVHFTQENPPLYDRYYPYEYVPLIPGRDIVGVVQRFRLAGVPVYDYVTSFTHVVLTDPGHARHLHSDFTRL